MLQYLLKGEVVKRCPKCNLEKVFEEFGKDKQKIDGLRSYCKECQRIISSDQRKKDPEYMKKYSPQYREKNREILRRKAAVNFENNREKLLRQGRESYYRNQEEIAKRRKLKRDSSEARKKEAERQKEWRERNKEKYSSYIRKWQTKNRVKTNAHAKVNRAVSSGRLKRSMKCQECGLRCKTEGHHEDYSKPLDVIWLCRHCHASKLETVEV